MEKRISVTAFRSVKNVAKAIDPTIRKREAVKKKIEALAEEYKVYDKQVSTLEAGIAETIGFRVEELVTKVVETTGTDANGKPIKTTKYVPTNIVSYDEKAKQYVITVPNAAAEASVPETVSTKGSDFDADKEVVEASVENNQTDSIFN